MNSARSLHMEGMFASISIVDNHFNPLTVFQNNVLRAIDVSISSVLSHSQRAEQSRRLLRAVDCIVEGATISAVIATGA